MKILHGLLRFLSSFGFACILLLLLLVLTFAGTLEQTESGLYEVQKKYFESLFLTDLRGLPILLPGTYLLLVLLTVNLLLGGMLRMKRSWSRLGIYIVHFGILFLLFSSFLSYRSSIHGHLTLFEGETGADFVSHFDWEIAVYPADAAAGDGAEMPATVTEQIVTEAQFRDLVGARWRVFEFSGLPFQLVVTNFMKNSTLVQAAAGHVHDRLVVDGLALAERPPEKQAEANLAGAEAVIRTRDGREIPALLWGADEPPFGPKRYPFVFMAEGKRYAVDLRHVRRNLPFSVKLDKFTHERHPGTNMPKVFRSDVTKTQDGVVEPVKISMNEPLREQGFTLYQSNYGEDPGVRGLAGRRIPTGRMYSGFSVVENPHFELFLPVIGTRIGFEDLPLIACIIISLGLLIHFLRKLSKYVQSQARSRS